MVEEFSAVADFLLVYVDEAHPSDGWAATSQFQLPRHRSLAQRCSAASLLLQHFRVPPPCRVVTDCMDNNSNAAYGVSFERFCIVQDEKIAYLGGKGPFFYNLSEVRTWLEKQSSGKV